MTDDVLVSVICLAYNHREYIADAIEGCLSQIVNFKYEMIIHDDASVDGTADTIRQYEKKYPGIVKGIYETENQYSKSDHFIELVQEKIMSEADGKYVMWCEGDDYWIDPTKMQRQIDYLEENPDCAMVVHGAAVLDMNHVKVSVLPKYWTDKNISPEEIINHPDGYIGSATMAYRMEDFVLRGFYSEAGIGDYTARLYCLTKGRIYYMDRIMSVYRFGYKGSWQDSQKNSSYLRFRHCIEIIRFLALYDYNTDSKYLRYISKEIDKYVDIATDINSTEDIRDHITDAKLREDIDYQPYLDEIFRIYDQIHSLDHCDEKIINFVRHYEKVLIMGAGKYAAILAEQLSNNKIEFDGFVVSPDKKGEKEYRGKPVYKMDKLPYDSKNVGILVGIHAGAWEEVESALIENGAEHYYCPYLFALENVGNVSEKQLLKRCPAQKFEMEE